MKLCLSLIFVIVLSGCVWPGIDNRKQGPLDNRPIKTSSQPFTPTNGMAVPTPQAMAITPSQKVGSAAVYWKPVQWGRPVSYFVGWGLSAGNYTQIANTAGTNYTVYNLKPNTLYYFSVKTIDSLGLQSDWGQWYHYFVPKQTGPSKPQPPSTAQ